MIASIEINRASVGGDVHDHFESSFEMTLNICSFIFLLALALDVVFIFRWVNGLAAWLISLLIFLSSFIFANLSRVLAFSIISRRFFCTRRRTFCWDIELEEKNDADKKS